MGWSYLSIPKLQRLHCWRLERNFIPHFTGHVIIYTYWELIRVSERGTWSKQQWPKWHKWLLHPPLRPVREASSGGPWPCITNVIATCRKNFSQWERSFLWKLRYHWLEFLRRVAKTLVIQGPVELRLGRNIDYQQWGVLANNWTIDILRTLNNENC